MNTDTDDFWPALQVGAQEAIDADLGWIESNIAIRLAKDLARRSERRKLFNRGELYLD